MEELCRVCFSFFFLTGCVFVVWMDGMIDSRKKKE